MLFLKMLLRFILAENHQQKLKKHILEGSGTWVGQKLNINKKGKIFLIIFVRLCEFAFFIFAKEFSIFCCETKKNRVKNSLSVSVLLPV